MSDKNHKKKEIEELEAWIGNPENQNADGSVNLAKMPTPNFNVMPDMPTQTRYCFANDRDRTYAYKFVQMLAVYNGKNLSTRVPSDYYERTLLQRFFWDTTYNAGVKQINDSYEESLRIRKETIDIRALTCAVCRIAFDTKEEATNHFRYCRHSKHTEYIDHSLLQCSHCSKTYATPSSRRKHEREYHSSGGSRSASSSTRQKKAYRCDWCNVELEKLQIGSHIRDAHPEAKCEPCNQFFRSRRGLKLHKRKHSATEEHDLSSLSAAAGVAAIKRTGKLNTRKRLYAEKALQIKDKQRAIDTIDSRAFKVIATSALDRTSECKASFTALADAQEKLDKRQAATSRSMAEQKFRDLQGPSSRFVDRIEATADYNTITCNPLFSCVAVPRLRCGSKRKYGIDERRETAIASYREFQADSRKTKKRRKRASNARK